MMTARNRFRIYTTSSQEPVTYDAKGLGVKGSLRADWLKVKAKNCTNKNTR